MDEQRLPPGLAVSAFGRKSVIYATGQKVKEVKGYQQHISGDEVLPGFTFDLGWIQK
ncbi:hypothetical protein OKW21_000354 [Catalinimonas alkaloidigena]|uniref:hypothetical protein n=1 Tax=Catalinimonas alkaloidigena TaxID=1075417 RepID=UPI002405B8C7|nr:hypothetical protein [Catalinimonas alkaloidigena]MDF9795091.1 hypothetical protein [Catalinimonas alkaloidigena]